MSSSSSSSSSLFLHCYHPDAWLRRLRGLCSILLDTKKMLRKVMSSSPQARKGVVPMDDEYAAIRRMPHNQLCLATGAAVPGTHYSTLLSWSVRIPCHQSALIGSPLEFKSQNQYSNLSPFLTNFPSTTKKDHLFIRTPTFVQGNFCTKTLGLCTLFTPTIEE